MDPRTYAAETGGSSSAATDVSTELTALRADVAGLAESVKRLVAEAPDLAMESLETSIRRNPLQATLIAAGIGFVLSLILTR
jgi:ElaB/YqjD/DUF883 family membrane-anchored ribosome-binding protein